VRFDPVSDQAALPVFEPGSDSGIPRRAIPSLQISPECSAASVPAGAPGEHRTVISGVGLSQVGRRLFRSPLDLTIEAALRALADAGIGVDEIDGIATQPGAIPDLAPGFNGPTACQVMDALGLKVNWLYGGMEGPGQFGPIMAACHAVAASTCRHALVFRTVTESSAQTVGSGAGGHRPGAGAGAAAIKGDLAFLVPYGSMSAANWLALYATRHMHEFGTTREQLGAVVLAARRHAALNPEAIYREPLTMERYLAARVVTTPFGLYDCDIPCDMSAAVVISLIEAARDLRREPVRIAALGMAKHGRPRWDQVEDLTGINAEACAAQMWARTDLKPADVDVAQLYDGFSFMVLGWLEALGFCKKGEAGPFVEDGRIEFGGPMPVNTWGGQLSGGRLHAFGHLIEAVRQLRGECGLRQVPGCNVAVASAAGVVYAGCMLLTRY
jgi:acetyl-CoA acetyltransferase